MLVSGLTYEASKEEDCERNISDAIQYLTSYLAGNGYVPITKTFPDGVPVILMEDAATLVPMCILFSGLYTLIEHCTFPVGAIAT